MNRLEHLLTKLIDECAEIQQATTKALNFGLEDGYPNTDRTNVGDMRHEFNDLIGVVHMLEAEGLNLSLDMGKIQAKKVKVEHWLKYSKQQGMLTE